MQIRIRISIIIVAIFLCNNLIAQKNYSTSIYYLIRHSEKLDSATSDPPLSPEGIKRAEEWVKILNNISFDAIYSTDFIRTRETARPLAKKSGLEIVLYNPKEIDYEKFKSDTSGKTVLIVGHSNTIPVFVNQLIGKEKYGLIEDDNFGNLYIVQISEITANDLVLSIN